MSLIKKNTWVSALSAVAVVTTVALASDATLPHVFTAGTTAVAAQVNANFNAVKTAIDDNFKRIQTLEASKAVLFTRWGVAACPTGSTLIYSGYAASSNHATAGSGANVLCLTDTPKWTTPTGALMVYSDADNNESRIFGTEYQTSSNAIGFSNRHNYDGVCAVCKATGATLSFMLPGSATCPTGWTTQYYGYIMSTDLTATVHHKSEYNCVDATATASGSSTNNDVGNIWEATEAECGSLPCKSGGYVQNREIVCSVCTQ